MKISRLDINYTLPKEAIFSNFTEIISSSYHYDALGNLIEDDSEGIEVDWNVIGKVRFVQTPNNVLQFAYNPFGQRQIKRTLNDTTYYVHDATGNVMGIYVKDGLTITTQERPIYGSSRLGILNKEVKSPQSAVRRLPSFYLGVPAFPPSYPTHAVGLRPILKCS